MPGLAGPAGDTNGPIGPIRMWLGNGIWKITQAAVRDAAGNTHFYLPADLAALHAAKTFTVVSRADIKKPTMSAFHRTPAAVDVRTSSKTVSFSLRAKDAKSGVAYVGVSMSGAANANAMLHRRSGTIHDGKYAGKLTLTPCASRKGIGTLTVTVIDVAGNFRRYTGTALGANKSVTVNALDHTIPGASLSSGTALAGPVTVNFTEDVTGINATDAIVAPSPDFSTVGTPVAGTWSCTTASLVVTPCDTGNVRHAAFTPTAPFTTQSYVVVLNPSGTLGVTDLFGNPFDQFKSFFFPF